MTQNKIKLFKVSNFSYTPFNNFNPGDLDYLKAYNIEIVNSSKEADIIISQNFKHIKKHFWKFIFGKKFLVWTLEPRFDTHFLSTKKYFFGLFKCHFMNIYTQDVFVSNLTFHAGMMSTRLEPISEDFQLNSKQIVALMSCYKGLNSEKLIYNNQNIDLIATRTEIALEGNKLGILDVYGKGWPSGVSKEDSREGDWPTRKKELLKPYHFNLCFENTASPNYMTEKIWGSIQDYCLPIYYGKNTNAYDLFPKDSFLDYSEFKNPTELFDYINMINTQEYIARMNKCIAVYNSINEKGPDFVKEERKKMLDKIVEKLHSI